MLALDFKNGGRREGVGTGQLDGNAVHEECDEIASMVSPTFGVNAIVDDKGRATRIFAGGWRTAHQAACEHYLAEHSRTIGTKRPLVIVSCGGYPYDINFIQAHKALEMAAQACQDGGTIILLAACVDGLGRSDFLKWFESKDSATLEARLRDSYEVNGQTAWAVMTKAERFSVILVSQLDETDVLRMRMRAAPSLEVALTQVAKNTLGFVLPRGAALLPLVSG
jgi:nickel-dependent lactate racemase